jgi:hypothetical protein
MLPLQIPPLISEHELLPHAVLFAKITMKLGVEESRPPQISQ